MDELTTKLSKIFDPSVVKTREGPGGRPLTYIGVGEYADRLLNSIDNIDDMHVEIEDVQVVGPFPVTVRGKFSNAVTKKDEWTSVNAQQSSVIITVAVTVKGSKRTGVGADDIMRHNINKYSGLLESTTDIDKACKTALAEGFKKACFYFGIATYLWKDDKVDDNRDDRPVQQHTPTPNQPVQPVKQEFTAPSFLTKLTDVRTRLGFGKTEMPALLKAFMKTTYNIDVEVGSPDALIGKDETETSSRVDKFIAYMENLAQKK